MQAQLGSPFRISEGQNQGLSQSGLSSGGFGRESAAKLIQDVGRTQFLTVVGPHLLAAYQAVEVSALSS